ncbi:sensor histidine kinase regulating citrate/malate metabolism [Anaerotaenia torta]|uniref:GHKL domain-containing protein n=1 Tax=Anaerotaenia torta TaxID=433293 RepID=UPI003D24D591
MQTILLEIQKKSYTVGNEIIDAILNYYTQVLEDDVKIYITGLCNVKLAINNVELCSIVSNPLQNAIEAIRHQKQGKKYLYIQMHSAQDNFRMEIRNSHDADSITLIHGLPWTKNSDKKNHGIGLKNVQKLVKKNNGEFKIDIEPGEFKITLVLPIAKSYYLG